MKLTEYMLYKTAIKAQVKSGAGVRCDRWRTDRSVTLTYVTLDHKDHICDPGPVLSNTLGLPWQRSRQPSQEDLLVRRPKSVKTIDSATPPGRTLSKDISIAFYLSSFLLLVSLLF